MQASKLLMVALSGFSIGLVVAATPASSAPSAPARIGVVQAARPDAVSAPGGGQQTPTRSVTSVGATHSSTTSVRLPAAEAAAAAAATLSPPATDRASKLLVIVEENETTRAYTQMPYLKSLSARYGTATRYTGLVHPSLGNYLVMVSGQGPGTCGLRDPLPAPCPQAGATVFGRALSAGHPATTYAESMVTPCQTTNSTRYAARHNPWAYFTNERSVCKAHDVPMGTLTSGALRSDINAGTLPTVGMMVPNLVNDAHDGTLGQADAWLHTWLPQIMAGPDYRSGRLAVVITFDEGTGANQNVPFVVVHRSLSHKIVATRYTHNSLSRLYTDVLGLSPLGAAATEPGLRAAFGI